MAAHEDDQVADVEEQLPQTYHNSSPAITTTTTTQTPENSTDNSKLEEIVYPANLAIRYIFIAIIFLIAFPFLLAYVIGSVCLTAEVRWPGDCFSCNSGGSQQPSVDPRKKAGIYKKMVDFKYTKEKIQRLNLVATTRVGCILVLWMVVNLCVPSLTRAMLFGCPLWKWSALTVLISLGFPSSAVATAAIRSLVVDLVDELTERRRLNFEYFVDGLQDSLTSLLHLGSILVMWMLYFWNDHGLNPRVHRYVTWTIVSLLVGAILWVLKSATLLEWKANAVYKRFKGRILTAGFQLYFLSYIIDQKWLPVLLPWRYDGKQDDQDKNGGVARNDMLSKQVTKEQLDEMAGYIARLAMVTLREDDGIPEIVDKYQEKIPCQDGRVECVTEEALVKNFQLPKDDAKLLLDELEAEQLSKEITYDTFQKWMVDAHKNCVSLAYTLIDAFAVVSVLNRVIIGLIAAGVILL